MNRHERRQAAHDERRAQRTAQANHFKVSGSSLFAKTDPKAFGIITTEHETTSSAHPDLLPHELHVMVQKSFDHALLMLRLLEHEHGFEQYRPDVSIDDDKFSLDRLSKPQ